MVAFKNKLMTRNDGRDELFQTIFDDLKTEMKVVSDGGRKANNKQCQHHNTNQELSLEQVLKSQLNKSNLTKMQKHLLQDRELLE